MALIQYQELAEPLVPTAAAAAVPNLTPPGFPERVHRRALPVAAMLFFAGPVLPPPAPTVPPLAVAVFPDSVPRAAPRNPGFFAFVADLGSFPLPAPLCWHPQFPDFAPGARRGAELWRFAFLPELGSFALPAPLCWQPRFPDALPRPRRPEGLAAGKVDPPTVAPAFPELSWAPRFPDGFPRSRRPEGFAAGKVDPPAAVPFPELSWAPGFPDFLRRPRAPEGLAAGRVDPPAAAPAAPALSWQPSFPDVLPRPRLAPGFVAARVDPPTAAVPTLSWAPQYPDRLAARARAVEFSRLGLVLDAVAAPSWQPSFPDRTPTARRAAELWRLGFVAVVVPAVPAPALSWQPAFPDFARAARRPVNEGGTSLRVPRPPDDTAVIPHLTWEGPFDAELSGPLDATLSGSIDATLSGALGATLAGPLDVVIVGPLLEGSVSIPGCKQNDRPLIEVTVLDSAGNALEIPVGTAVKLYFVHPATGTTPINGVTMTAAPDQVTNKGEATYQTLAGHAANIGEHKVEVRLVYAGGIEITAPGLGYRYFQVDARLAA